MGCNCKKKVNAINEKFGDGEEGDEKISPFLMPFVFIFRIIFGILFGFVAFIIFIPMLVYVIICNIIGKEPSFSISKLIDGIKKLAG